MEAILFILMMVVVPLGFIIGRYKDPYWRVKMRRSMLKTDEILLELVSRDGKSSRILTINPTSGAFLHKGRIWLATDREITRASIDENKVRVVDLKRVENVFIKDGDRIVIQKKKGRGKTEEIIPMSALKQERERGLVIQKSDLHYVEGVPMLRVDEDHLTPIPAARTREEPSITPEEMFAMLRAWVENERQKDKASSSQGLDLVQIITLVLIVGCLALNFIVMEEVGSLRAVQQSLATGQGSAVAHNPNIPYGSSIDGDKIVVK